MKTKRLMRSFLKVAVTAFLVFLAGNAFAIDNSTRVVSPYWQVDTGSYSFIAVTHSSLSGMNSQIGMKVTALDSAGTSYGTAAEFTINSGVTQRIFIVPTTHTTLNPTSLTDSDVTFIRGTSDYTYGLIRIDPTATCPSCKFLTDDPDTAAVGHSISNGFSEGLRDVTMLGFWGSVVVEANTTGFAMEFIGDMNDSAGGTEQNCESIVRIGSSTTKRTCIVSGVNLQ